MYLYIPLMNTTTHEDLMINENATMLTQLQYELNLLTETAIVQFSQFKQKQHLEQKILEEEKEETKEGDNLGRAKCQ